MSERRRNHHPVRFVRLRGDLPPHQTMPFTAWLPSLEEITVAAN
ncbi:hypothetical protein [Streptomyces europaeiscabiei]|nr:hypothetical protein OG858_00730 [Streptomyces europaeiscabiei]